MFIATDINKDKVSINDANKQESYFCPICGAPLIIRAEKSNQIAIHFAHKRGTHCTDDWKYEMSEWHKAWQERFPVECREIVMEKDGEKHRADVFVQNTVIEFQHSPISYEDFTKRNFFYLKCGYSIIWIFDAKNKIKDSIEEIIKSVFKKHPCTLNDCYERTFKWKRYQNQFADFHTTYPEGSPIEIYVETNTESRTDNVLIRLKEVDAISPKVYYMHFCITTKNFLKEYHCLNDSQVKSISDLIKNTEFLQKYIQSLFNPPLTDYSQRIDNMIYDRSPGSYINYG